MECSTNLNKICKICGDKALNFNFGGLSCETCKIFFRRNAFNYEKIKCKNNTDKCVINSLLNRKKCKRCRLSKCFTIGMRKELISLKKENNRCKTVKNTGNCQFRKISYDNSCLSPCTMATMRPVYNTFDELELVKYGEVQRAMAHFPEEFEVPTDGEARDLLHTFNLPALYIRKIIKFCKGIKAFQGLSLDDQIVILREFYCEISCLRFAFLFDVQRDAFRAIESETENKALWIQLKVFEEFQRRNNLPSIYREFYTKLNLEMRNDCKLRNLVIAYFLFNDRPFVSCPELLRTNRSVYNRLLRKYIDHKYCDPQKYYSLKRALSGLAQICDVTREVYASFPTDQLSKVLVEIYHPEYQKLHNSTPNSCAFNFEQIRELQSSLQIDEQTSDSSCSETQNLCEILNFGEFYIRKAVKFSCNFSCYKALNDEEQKFLLKHSIVEMMLVYVAFFYDHQRDGISLIANEKSIFIDLKLCHLNNQEIVSIFREFASTLCTEMNNDAFVRNLIMIQLLFKLRPSSQQANAEYSRYNCTFYRHLLFRYFEYKFKNHIQMAESKFAQILNIIDNMENVGDLIRHLYTREVDSTKLAPLLREIFDI